MSKEARVELERLLRLSTERYVSPYNVAMIYHGLGEREATLAWLERGYHQREPRMVFLKVEPKWAVCVANRGSRPYCSASASHVE
jgi:hypothetical protein